MTLTTRTKIELRYTSNPSLLGYANTPEKGKELVAAYLESTPEIIGTPRQIQEKIAELAKMFGQTFYRIDLRTRKTQENITRHDIDMCVEDAKYDRLKKAGRI
jgi:cytochrome oxidase Cu insertion factor (SCO1/SenC/PrrC family)